MWLGGLRCMALCMYGDLGRCMPQVNIHPCAHGYRCTHVRLSSNVYGLIVLCIGKYELQILSHEEG